MIQQTTFTLRARARGFHLVTDEVLSHLPALPKTGLLNLFIQHTSAGLSVNENCDPDVRSDMEKIFNNLERERESWYDHTLEGWDDMPAHAKSSLVGASLSIPITDGRLNLGTWQGIYLCEFRNHGGGRRIVVPSSENNSGNRLWRREAETVSETFSSFSGHHHTRQVDSFCSCFRNYSLGRHSAGYQPEVSLLIFFQPSISFE